MTNQPCAVITQPGSVKDLHAFGNTLTVMLAGRQSGGTIAVMSEQTPPGGGPPLHVHHNEDEIFLVIEGRISYFVDGNWIEVGAGGLVYLPRGAAHCYRNIGDTPSRHWIFTMPSGFESFFSACAAEFSRPDPPSPERLAEIHQAHGIDLLEPPRA